MCGLLKERVLKNARKLEGTRRRGRRRKQLLDDLKTRDVLLNETGSTRSLICGELVSKQAVVVTCSPEAVEKGAELDWGYGHAISRISFFLYEQSQK